MKIGKIKLGKDQWIVIGGAASAVAAAVLLFRGSAGGASPSGGFTDTTGLAGAGSNDVNALFSQLDVLGQQVAALQAAMPSDTHIEPPTTFTSVDTPQVVDRPAAKPIPAAALPPGPAGFETNVVTLREGANTPAAPIIPGVDWSREAVAGYFAQGGDAFHRFGLSETPVGAPAVFTKTAAGFDVSYGTTRGSVAPTQRFVGYAPGTNVPIFQ